MQYSRQCLAIHIDRQITADQVLAVLRTAMARIGTPGYIRSNNGSKFIAKKVPKGVKEKCHLDAVHWPRQPLAEWLHRNLHGRFRDEYLLRE